MPSTKKRKWAAAPTEEVFPDGCSLDPAKYKEICDSYFALRKVPPDGTPLLDAIRAPLRRKDLVAVRVPDGREMKALCRASRERDGVPAKDEIRLIEYEGGIFFVPVGMPFVCAEDLRPMTAAQHEEQRVIQTYLDARREFKVVCNPDRDSYFHIVKEPGVKVLANFVMDKYVRPNRAVQPGEVVVLRLACGGLYPLAVDEFMESICGGDEAAEA